MAVVFDPLLGKLRMADDTLPSEPGTEECDCEAISPDEIETVIETTDNN